ncbi:MAG: hypothetical protein GY888_32325 [Planctomycetaceae bacterium]|nr:hypothetical protein [Planctomycetaceae bacterium]
MKQIPWLKMVNQVTQMAAIFWTSASNRQFHGAGSNNCNDLSCPEGLPGKLNHLHESWKLEEMFRKIGPWVQAT